MGAARNELLGAIPTQKLESPAKTTPQTWRPSPGYSPSKAGDPAPPAAKPPGGGKKAGPGKSDVPWETAPQRLGRQIKERNYNKELAGGQMARPTSTSSASSYRLSPLEAANQKARQSGRDAKTIGDAAAAQKNRVDHLGTYFTSKDHDQYTATLKRQEKRKNGISGGKQF